MFVKEMLFKNIILYVDMDKYLKKNIIRPEYPSSDRKSDR